MTKRGTISLTFDDGYETVYQNVVPLLDSYNLPGVFALTIDHKKFQQSVNRPIHPWQEWLPIQNHGHEIASHTVSHPDLPKLSDADLVSELRDSADALGATTLVYPGGSTNQIVTEVAAKHYTAARTIRRGFETVPPRDPLQLASYNFSRNNFSVVKANLLALWAWTTNSWLIETYHMVDDSETEMVHTVRTRDLDRHLRFVAKLPIHVRTISQVIGDHHHQKRGG